MQYAYLYVFLSMEVRGQCVFLIMVTLFFEAESLIELGAYPFDGPGWPVSSKDLPVSSALALGLQACIIPDFFCGC